MNTVSDFVYKKDKAVSEKTEDFVNGKKIELQNVAEIGNSALRLLLHHMGLCMVIMENIEWNAISVKEKTRDFISRPLADLTKCLGDCREMGMHSKLSPTDVSFVFFFKCGNCEWGLIQSHLVLALFVDVSVR